MTNKKKTKAVLVTVTKEDIRFGVRGSWTRCPIACALRRALPKVRLARLVWTPNVVDFISRFDLDGKEYVEPFSFVVYEDEENDVENWETSDDVPKELWP